MLPVRQWGDEATHNRGGTVVSNALSILHNNEEAQIEAAGQSERGPAPENAALVLPRTGPAYALGTVDD